MNIDVALVVNNPESPYTTAVWWKTWLEGREYVNSVTYEDIDTVTQEQLNAYDLVWSCRVDLDMVKCKGLDVPVIFTANGNRQYLKFGMNMGYSASQTQINITSNSHYITEVFELGNLTVYISSGMGSIVSWSQDVTPLAKLIDKPTNAMVLYLEKGDKHTDETICTERMVFCGLDYATKLLENGDALFDRIVSWCMYDYGQVVTPEFAPDEDTYSEAQDVTITCETDGVTIKYTTDGSEPASDHGTEYSEPVAITENTVLKAIAYKAGWDDSEIKVGNYYFKPATPTFDPIEGEYVDFVDVTIACATEGATIKYTTDGSEPSQEHGIEYTSPVHISETTTLKAIAYKDGWNDSDIKSGEYYFKVATPTFNPDGGTYTEPVDVTISCSTSGVTIRYTIDGSDPTLEYGTIYTNPVHIEETTTLKAIAYKTDWLDSDIKVAVFSFAGTIGDVIVSVERIGRPKITSAIDVKPKIVGTISKDKLIPGITDVKRIDK